MKTTLYVLACVALTMLAVSCIANPGKAEARAALVDEITKTIVDSGALVTFEQVEAIDAKLAAYENEPDGVLPDWAELPLAIVGSLLAARGLPNRFLLGTQPDPEVARVAGVAAKV